MSAAHTPGPWSTDFNPGGYRRKPYHIVRGPGPRSRLIARVESDSPEDAALIAAAPELLAAACEVSLAAIAKVDGRS